MVRVGLLVHLRTKPRKEPEGAVELLTEPRPGDQLDVLAAKVTT